MSGSIPLHVFGTCHNDGCDEVCPSDMAAVAVDRGTVCCSPDCAREVVERMDDDPAIITYHEPQYHVDRRQFGVADQDVTFVYCEVHSSRMALSVIGDIEDAHPGEFRPTRGGSDGE